MLKERTRKNERRGWAVDGRLSKTSGGQLHWLLTMIEDTHYTHTAYTRHWLVTIITELCSATSDRLQLITVTIDRQLRDRGSTVPNTELGAARLELSGVGLNLA